MTHFKYHLTKSERVMSKPSKTFEGGCYNTATQELNLLDLESSFSIDNFEISDNLNEDFEKSLSSMRALKIELNQLQEEKNQLSKIVKNQADSIRILTLENEVCIKEQSIYREQIRKLEKLNFDIKDDFDIKMVNQANEHSKQINALNESLSQNLVVSQNVSVESKKLSSLRDVSGTLLGRNKNSNEVSENTLKKKISLLEVKLLEIIDDSLQRQGKPIEIVF